MSETERNTEQVNEAIESLNLLNRWLRDPKSLSSDERGKVAELLSKNPALLRGIDKVSENLGRAEHQISQLERAFGDALRIDSDVKDAFKVLEPMMREPAGGHGVFNKKDLNEIKYAFNDIKDDLLLMLAELKQMVEDLIDAIAKVTKEDILAVVAAAQEALASIIDPAASVIDAVCGNTGLGKMKGEFKNLCNAATDAAKAVASEAKAKFGLIAAKLKVVWAQIKKIMDLLNWILNTVQHALGVMAVPAVPKLPLPICGWDIEDPYYWTPGMLIPEIIPEPLIIAENTEAPTIIVQGPNNRKAISAKQILEEPEWPTIGEAAETTIFDAGISVTEVTAEVLKAKLKAKQNKQASEAEESQPGTHVSPESPPLVPPTP